MADKNVVVTEPVAKDVKSIHIRYDKDGALVMLAGSIEVVTDNGAFHPENSFSLDPLTLAPEVQNAVKTLVDAGLAQFKTDHGF